MLKKPVSYDNNNKTDVLTSTSVACNVLEEVLLAGSVSISSGTSGSVSQSPCDSTSVSPASVTSSLSGIWVGMSGAG